MNKNNNRYIQFDALKIIAAFAVVWLHASAQRFNECYPSIEWDIRNFYDSLVRWAVPIFIMISGALFLNPNKEIDIKSLYSKYIIRLLLIFLFWSIIYCAYDGAGEMSLIGLVGRCLYGPFHFWFLKMLIGLYICVPILKPIVKNKKLELYFICLSVVTAFVIPMFFHIIGFFSDATRNYAENYYDAFGIKIALAHVGYFVLGHYLAHTIVSERAKNSICLLGMISVVAICVLTRYVSTYIGKPWDFLYGINNLFTLFEASAIFVVLKDKEISPKYYDIIVLMSKLSLGVYIIHPIVMSIMFDFCGVYSASINPMFFIPVFSIIVFLISCLFSFGLNKVPFIRKFVS